MAAYLRLDQIISDTGLYSRSEAKALIRSGCVSADGQAANRGSEKYDPYKTIISVNGGIIRYSKYCYIMLNKPAGYVSSTEDRNEKTVLQLLDQKYSKLGVFPAGRLDKDAEGLLLLTNDGDLAHRVISPDGKISKRYFVKTDKTVTRDDIDAFSGGLTLGDGTVCLPAILEPAPGGALVTVYEGKYHQVKRMMSAIGKPVKYLKRISVGGLQLDEDMEPGQYREIGDEIAALLDNK